ncbi:M2 family metallopeptidase, partial [Sphingomonas sp.]|uniref:M2 family metallopeptidase n=1 Tax=Sphingomonas sp. TaxID=28214 RepID=UPI002DBDF2A5
MKRMMISALAVAAALAAGSAVAQQPAAPTAAEADAFVANAEKQLADFSVDAARVAWINNTYITDDTDALAAKYGTIGTQMAVKFAKEAARFQKVPDL